MRLDDEFDDGRGGLPIIYTAIGVSAFILLVLGIVIAANKSSRPSGDYQKYVSDLYTTNAVAEENLEPVPTISENKRVASDLDIWDMYPEVKDDKKPEQPDVSVSATPRVTPSPSVTEEVDYNDGKHVKITYKDGSEEWIAINDKIDKNNYDFSNLIDSGGKYKYVSDGKTTSFVGVDISRYQKDIDFNQVKDQGIDFVMIRVGSRGYKNGTLSLDEYFETNIVKAKEAGLDVGVYFYSQAINGAEAEEEANLVINAIADKGVTYPVAFDMEYVDNDSSRIDTLTKDEKTFIASAFLNKIKEAGYRPMIYGNKEWLLKRIDVAKFTASSIWLAQDDPQPDYPYSFDMWQYSRDGNVYGIEGPVDMDICFVDYAAQ